MIPPDLYRRAVEAAQQPGVPERTVQLPSGEMAAGDYLSELFADTLVHTWDLADATGGDRRLDPELVDACTGWFGTVEDGWRRSGEVGPAASVPADADPQSRLLARFGRTP